MEVIGKKIKVSDLIVGYTDNDEEGIVAFKGELDIRPPYQREFVYNDEQRRLVIHSILNDYPLNIMYWNIKDDDSFEILDGQQRTISICQFANDMFDYDGKYFSRLANDLQDKFLVYELDIYRCKGTDSERIAWFEIINVAGEELTQQELLNAVYAGSWTAAAKRKFSKKKCAAWKESENLVPTSLEENRQHYLELALKWKTGGGKEEIRQYMNQHADDDNCDDLWEYWENLFAWVRNTFIGCDDDKRYKEMRSVNWGELFNNYGQDKINPQKIQKQVNDLFEDGSITKYSGIYPYVFDKLEKHLNIRQFQLNEKRFAYTQQGGVCANKKDCPEKGAKLKIEEMEADHIKPWHEGGKTEQANCQMLCKHCNRTKGGK